MVSVSTEEGTAAMSQIMLAQPAMADYPYLAELTTKHVLEPG